MSDEREKRRELIKIYEGLFGFYAAATLMMMLYIHIIHLFLSILVLQLCSLSSSLGFYR